MDIDSMENFKLILNNWVDQSQKLNLNLEMETTNSNEVDVLHLEKENLLVTKLIGRKEFFLKKIKNALIRIDEGTFGTCIECGGDIELPRLKARPTATKCISCKEEEERVESHILYENKSKTKGLELTNNVLNFVPKFGEQENNTYPDNLLPFNKKSYSS
jgi:DnaK suppressor protein